MDELIDWLLGRGILEHLASSFVWDQDGNRKTDKRTLNGEDSEKETQHPEKPELVAAQSGPTVNSPIVQLCSSRRQPPVSEPPGLPGPVSEPTLSREQSCVLPQQPGLTELCQFTFRYQGQITSSSNSPDPCPSLTFGGWQFPAHSEQFQRKMQKPFLFFWLREPQLCQGY